MIDTLLRFKISSETDINELIKLNNMISKRIQILQTLQRTPKAEVKEEKEKIKDDTNST